MESMELRRSWVEEQHYVHDSVFLANKLENCERRIKFEFPNMALQAISDNLCIISGGDELVPRVVIDVPSSIEVPNNNSLGLQLVEHMANNVASSIEVANNNSDPQDGKNDGDLKPGALIAVADCATSITAIMFHPPSSGDPVYLVAVGIVFTAGMLAVLATLWVACDSRKRRTAKKKIMYASVAPFILGLVLNVYAYKVKK
ncbi:hypothetical protein ACQ4PT_015098 [Festuca glaucescens]